MEQGLKIVTEYGEFIQPSMLTPEAIQKLNDEQIEAVTEYIRLFSSYKPKLEAEIKRRISENGTEFNHANITTSTTLKTGDLTSTVKAEFLKDWG
ncbi:molybdopterin biosynthesis protein, partial [Weissella oryzae SG25]